MIQCFKVPVPLPDGMEERNAYIYLPGSYFRNEKKRYPVLYMFDGHNIFFDSDATYGKSWGMTKFMNRSHTQMIIAAVECNHSPNNGRLEEYSPFSFQDPTFGFVHGRGKSTMEWFIYEFKAYIDSVYRTLPDRAHTFIAGSSMGGLMSLYALLEYNSVFSRAAALSPSLWTAPEDIQNLITQTAPKLDADTVLYMDYGSEEMNYRPKLPDIFAKTADLLLRHQVALDCRIVPGGTHCEASWERQIPFFMNTLLYRK